MAGRQGSPYAGKLSARPAGKPGDFFIVEGEFATIPSTPPDSATTDHTGRPVCVFQGMAESIWSDGVSKSKPKSKPILGRDHTASRWSAPSPGKRTRREDHALSHRPQMSSGRLFLDRVGRHQSPSPLRRHAQTTTHFPRGFLKPELSTLLGTGTFYFALTRLGSDSVYLILRIGTRSIDSLQLAGMALDVPHQPSAKDRDFGKFSIRRQYKKRGTSRGDNLIQRCCGVVRGSAWSVKELVRIANKILRRPAAGVKKKQRVQVS
jgi:hypothetical protein